MRTGTAHLPLHGGMAPRWLFARMVALSREILRVTVEEYGPGEMLTRVRSIDVLRQAVDRAKLNDRDKLDALRRLARVTED